MDTRANIVNSMILSLRRCTNRNKYVLLLNELLSLFPMHAEKSLKLCLKSKIKKYTLIKEKRPAKDYSLYPICGNNQKYLVFQNFCSCFYFKEKVLCNDTDVMCKHILSVLLAESFKNYVNIFLDSSLFFEWFMKKLRT
ncbi:hypothetical protein PCYB_083480 [Plasmodium cynomolgi strain B]|uniref:SWIM-type domain-containing protein n=1 Tax=Plasmodium cynomolgi (strain B) TaxID=1120755 RepID=K6VAI0_PLACD|nr:hypothetical protein PCYB_083480 [Plasmodium cynomolgi strain B]GAB66187.1 hypothetical protein PCYB_083480 [Plasmodium cynomolgi strain B]